MSTRPPDPHSTSAAWRDRLDPAWTPEWIRRTLTDEPGPGMGAPFSDADAARFLRACGLTPPRRAGAPPAASDAAPDAALFERMWRWLEEHAGGP